jgi:hypothetical protein
MVKVGNIFVEHALKVALAEDQKVIQALATYPTQEALTIGISFRSPVGDPRNLDAAIGGNPGKLGGEFAVVIPDEVGRMDIERRGLAELLRLYG